MDFTGKPLKGLVYIDPEGLRAERQRKAWAAKSLEYVGLLPPK